MRTTRWWIAAALLGAACEQDISLVGDKSSDDVGVDTDPVAGALAPRIQIDPGEIRFGELPPDCPLAEVVAISNVGDATLEVHAIELRGPGVSAYAVSDAGPFSLEPGEATEVTVDFQAADYRAYEARLAVASNDPRTPTARVQVSGAGSVAAFREELFLQEQASAVDVLWVLDNSCSMESSLTAVANAMGTFIQSFVNLDLDYRMGITTTDMSASGEQGRFRGPWMDTSMSQADVVSEFVRQTDAGAQGSNDEKGFAAAKAALTTQANYVHNQGFLRDDATLAVVVVSDEDDRDATGDFGASNPQVTDNFVTWLKSLKPSPGDVSFSGMVLPASGSSFNAAPQYHRAIRATGGVWGDITNIDVNPFLTHLSFVAAGLEYRFALEHVPTNTTPSAITVRIEGGRTITIPHGVKDGWTYDPSTNEIVLWGDAIPEPSEELHVRYPYDAGCD